MPNILLNMFILKQKYFTVFNYWMAYRNRICFDHQSITFLQTFRVFTGEWYTLAYIFYFRASFSFLFFFFFRLLLVESSESLCSFPNISFDSDKLTTLEILNITLDPALPCNYLFLHQMSNLPLISFNFSSLTFTILF